MSGPDRPRVAVVIATRNRAAELDRTLGRLEALPEGPQLIVVDNASDDGTSDLVASRHPAVGVIGAPRNLGAAGRNIGVAAASAPYVAFSDDDSWWAPGALARAARALDAHDDLALVAARILVGPDEREDPVNAQMAASPLPNHDGLPGAPVLGFLACGAVVRRQAFLATGGFDPRLGIGGEERLLALDLRSRGYRLQYVDDVVAHHHPSRRRDPRGRRRAVARNDLWTAWLRRPLGVAASTTAGSLRRALGGDAEVRGGLRDALVGAGWVLRERRVVDPALEAELRLLER